MTFRRVGTAHQIARNVLFWWAVPTLRSLFHVADSPRRRAEHDGSGFHATKNHRTGADVGERFDPGAGKNGSVGTEVNAVFQNRVSGDVGVTVDRAEVPNADIVSERGGQIDQDVIAHHNIRGQHRIGTENAALADVTIRPDDRLGMNDRGEFDFSPAMVGNPFLQTWLADGDHRQSIFVENEIPYRTDDIQVGRRIAERIGIVVEKADRFPIPLCRRDVIRPGENFASEAAGADDI